MPGAVLAPVGDGWGGASAAGSGNGGEDGVPWSWQCQRPCGHVRLTVASAQGPCSGGSPDRVSPRPGGAHNPSRREGAASARGRPGKRKLCHVRGTGQRG
ncbi:hypothetical protein Shyhy01_51220 [Streptomyces hygroscopicus subsp. hygroscopicus]|nr:hypothetical protein Shyhy01_51220 [Streptomyces hygroscopicus subsp. hygroscopicus]